MGIGIVYVLVSIEKLKIYEVLYIRVRGYDI